MSLNKKHLMQAVLFASFFAIAESIIAGDGVGDWFGTISQPGYSLPIWGWGIVGGLYYVAMTVILYRLFDQKIGTKDNKAIWLIALLMIYNGLWNYLLFGLDSTLLAFVGLIPFVIYVFFVMTYIYYKDRVSGWILLIYVFWLLYDLYWTYGLWRLN